MKAVSGPKSIKVGSHEIKLIAIEKKSSPPEIEVAKAVPWDELFIDGAMSVNVNMHLPMSAAYEDVRLEVHGNNASALTLPEMRICRLEVTQVGPSMPCLCVARNTINKNKVSYDKLTNKNTTFNDHSLINIGDISVDQSSTPENERQFNLNFVATILDGIGFQSGSDYPFYMSLSIGPDLVWSDNITFPMQWEAPADMPSDKTPKLVSYLKDSTPIVPGYSTEAVVRLEVPPQTITNYSIEVVTFDEEVSICGVWITHVGRNIPCLDKDTKAEYELRRIGENSKAVMNFRIVANTGPNFLLSPKEETYANTIELAVMVRVKGSATENKFVAISIQYGPNSQLIKNRLEIPISKASAKTNKDFKVPKVFAFDTSDGSRIAGMGSSALLTFHLEMEGNSQAPIRTELISGKGFEICDAGVIKIGSNYPCFSPFDLKKRNSVFDLGMICNTFLDKEDAHQNTLVLGVAIRFNDTLKEGQTIKIAGQGFVGNSLISKKQNIDLVASQHIEQKMSNEFKPKIVPKSVTPFMAKIRDMVWIAFNLTIPPQSTIKVRVQANGAVEENRAIITVHGLKITSGGANIACPLANSNPALKFESSMGNSQVDVVSADLGYISNWGFSHAFGDAMPGDDDITIEVLAQFTDHPMTDENSDHTIKMMATLGNESDSKSISAAKYMRVLRTHSERPVIETEILINNSTVYDRNQVISATALIRHSNQSSGEPANPSLRLFLPPYLQFGEVIYTNARDKPIVQNNSVGSTVDIVVKHDNNMSSNQHFVYIRIN